MTPEQIAALNAANARFQSAWITVQGMDAQMSAANAKLEFAQRDVTLGAPTRAQRVISDAADALQRAQAERDALFQQSSNAHAELKAAQQAVMDAMTATFQGGPLERV